MPKRKTVQLNLDIVKSLIKRKCRSNVVFCEMMGRGNQPTWVTDWGRTPTPKNLPSPEEAAKMCEILQVEPEEILVREEDVVLVRNIIEKNKPFTQEGEGLSDREQLILQICRSVPESRQELLISLLLSTADTLKKFPELSLEDLRKLI